jgi:trk system potassium uptake protein TrkA
MYVIIVGVNNLSKSLVEWYSEHDNEITIIEKEFDKCHYFDQIFGPICQNGDATDIETQAIAGMNRADVLITATKSDKDNFLISMIAKSKFKVKKIINIVNDSNFSNAFAFFGIESVINLESLVLKSIEKETALLAPWIITELNTNPKKIIFAVRIDKESKIIGKSIQNLNLPRNTSVILIIRSNGLTDIPSNEKTIHTNDELLILTEEKNADKMLEYLS